MLPTLGNIPLAFAKITQRKNVACEVCDVGDTCKFVTGNI